MKIILVFKTHFDIGFTKLSSEIIEQYATEMLPQVIETCDGTADMGKLHYVWTMPSWPLKVMQKNKDRRADLDRLIRNGQVAFHALPFTSHTDFSSMRDMIDGMKYAVELAKEYDLPVPVSAKMTDVPGHGRILPEILARGGVKFLHLGCNSYACPPSVPSLFFWQGPDGSRVLTMYSKGGYGSGLVPPADWEFPVWMAMMHTQDNCGPQSAEMIRALAEEAKETYPDAEIVCGTMDDFYHELEKCDLSRVPVVTGDMADTWIHGVESYPKEVSEIRAANRAMQGVASAAFAQNAHSEEMSRLYEEVSDGSILFSEHTWGLDVKVGMDPMRVYEKKKFLAKKPSEEYKHMEASWEEQRERAKIICSGVDALKKSIKGGEKAIFNANALSYTGWVECESENAVELAGKKRVFVEALAPLSSTVPAAKRYPACTNALENHRYRITIDEEKKIITELYDKKLDRVVAKARGDIGVFSYRYDLFGIEDLTEYLRSYAYRFSDWGVRDNGKDNYPEIPHKTFYPECTGITMDGCNVLLTYKTDESSREYGDARELKLCVALPPEGEDLLVKLDLIDKQESPYVETGSFCLPLAEDHPEYRFNKNGNVIDPAKDIIDCCNHALYCLESYACAQGSDYHVVISTKDTPLCAIGEPGIHQFRKKYEEHEPVLFFNLFNNMWGTNFPQWMGGDYSYEFSVAAFEGSFNKDSAAHGLTQERGALVLSNNAVCPEIKVPEYMQLVFLKPVNGAWNLCLQDISGEEREAEFALSGAEITPCDLRGFACGEMEKDSMKFTIKPYGIYMMNIRKD